MCEAIVKHRKECKIRLCILQPETGLERFQGPAMHRDSFSPCNTIRPGRTVHWRPAGAALASLRASINARSVSFWVCAFRFRAERGAVPAMVGVVGGTGCWRLAVPTERSCEGGFGTPLVNQSLERNYFYYAYASHIGGALALRFEKLSVSCARLHARTKSERAAVPAWARALP